MSMQLWLTAPVLDVWKVGTIFPNNPVLLLHLEFNSTIMLLLLLRLPTMLTRSHRFWPGLRTWCGDLDAESYGLQVCILHINDHCLADLC